MSAKAVVHVLFDGEAWVVKVAGQKRAYRRVATMGEAVTIGRELAINRKCELVVQSQDGSIRSKDSFGEDPFPPVKSR